MEGAGFDVKKMHVVRIDPYDDVLEGLTSYIEQAGIRQAAVVGGYGTLAAHHLHWVAGNTLPTENTFQKGEGGTEILAMNGMIVEGAPHVHVALSTPDGAYGGHLEPGCIAYVLCEIMLAELDGPEMSHEKVDVEQPGKGKGKAIKLTFGS